jgi:hypothetical protein
MEMPPRGKTHSPEIMIHPIISLPERIPLTSRRTALALTVVLAGFSLALVASCRRAEPRANTRPVEYIIFEGGGPDQGPGGDHHDANRAAILEKFGPADPASSRMVGYGIQQIRILTRSAASIAASEVVPALDAAEKTGIPVWLHIDPYYAWGADDEKRAEDAPPAKFWEHPEMREWQEFPRDGKLPSYIPRLWFNWGPMCSPVAAVPAIGSPKFLELARTQLRGGVLDPLSARLKRWHAEGKDHLFAGINIGWETQVTNYHYLSSIYDPANPIVAVEPKRVEGLRMDLGLVGAQLGYASLHWRGWNEDKLQATAREKGISRDEMFRQIAYGYIHDYMETLARECHEVGIASDKVYTHIVALATVNPPDTFMPPIWTAVNRYSTPGFTMDNKGDAKYDLAKLKSQIAGAPGSRGAVFGAVETYFKLNDKNYVEDEASCKKELDSLFGAGASVQVIFGSFPFGPETQAAAINAIKAWRAEKPHHPPSPAPES